jgi:hypothetical protein
LVSEGNNLALGNKEGKLVLASVTELAELYAGNFRTGNWRQMGDL